MIDEKKLIEKRTYYPMPVSDYEAGWNECNRDWMERIEAQPQVGGWIPVSERLPEDGYGVLVTVNGKHNNITFINALEIAEYDSTDGWIVEGYLDWTNPDVTAWMPLPEPFKEEEDV